MSWGHTIEPLVGESDSAWGNPRLWCSNTRRCPGAHEYQYHIDDSYHSVLGPAPEGSGLKTHTHIRGGKSVVVASWQYVTGRKGRVSWAQRQYCEPCGEKFARKHKLTLPGEEPAAVLDLMQRLQESLAGKRPALAMREAPSTKEND